MNSTRSSVLSASLAALMFAIVIPLTMRDDDEAATLASSQNAASNLAEPIEARRDESVPAALRHTPADPEVATRALESPASDNVVHETPLSPSRQLSGRSILPNGDLAAYARVSLRVQVAISYGGEFVADEDGRFALHVPSDAKSVILDLYSHEGDKRRAVKVLGPFYEDRDLGDIHLDLPGRLIVHVRDGNGSPIPGARAEFAGTPSGLGSLADAQGRIDLRLQDGPSFICQASGYASTMIDVPRDVDADLVVTLERVTRLELVVRNRAAPRSSVEVELTMEKPFPMGSCPRVFGKQVVPHSISLDAPELRMILFGDETVSVSEIEPGVMIRVRLFAGAVDLAPIREFSLSAGEWRREVFDFSSVPRTLNLTVVDARGSAFEGVEVAADAFGVKRESFPGSWWGRAPLRTNAAGEATISDLHGDSLDVKVKLREERFWRTRHVQLEGEMTHYRLVADW